MMRKIMFDGKTQRSWVMHTFVTVTVIELMRDFDTQTTSV